MLNLADGNGVSLCHGVEPKEIVGIYRTYWSLMDRDDPSVVVRTEHAPLLEAKTHSLPGQSNTSGTSAVSCLPP